MKALQPSTSYSFVISSFPNLPRRPRNQQCIIRAKAEPSEKSVEIMRKFSEQYARKSGTYFCGDKSVTAVVIKGLAEHKDTLGAPLCPCRHYDDKAAEAGQGFWNCPCVPMRERYERLPKSMLCKFVTVYGAFSDACSSFKNEDQRQGWGYNALKQEN
ncbi:hypothetical protein Cgig2_013576 [Carnegiea gigantea]|uniref:Ferredoxin-thioredoxin reductase catalytic chain, chloroplastic n=1 Tax=Carnegiea gigantea TaxID=171969 RepID=A0A9Q1QFJ1_9CARY|nr:hypothetical protein Cgig2_013576 [Carnegiea gigantea]